MKFFYFILFYDLVSLFSHKFVLMSYDYFLLGKKKKKKKIFPGIDLKKGKEILKLTSDISVLLHLL